MLLTKRLQTVLKSSNFSTIKQPLLANSTLLHKNFSSTLVNNVRANTILGKKVRTRDRTLDLASKLENTGEYPKKFNLQAHYKLDFTEEELADQPDHIKKIFSLDNASDKEVLNYRINEAVRKFQTHPTDTSTRPVKIAILTEKIIHNIKYFYRTRRKNMYLYRTIQMQLFARDKILRKCRIYEPNYFKWVCDEYKIPYENDNIGSTIRYFKPFFVAETASEGTGKKALRRRTAQSKKRFPGNWPYKT